MTPAEIVIGSLVMALWLGGNVILLVPLTVLAVLSSLAVASTINVRTGNRSLGIAAGSVVGALWAAGAIMWEAISFLYVLELAGFGPLW